MCPDTLAIFLAYADGYAWQRCAIVRHPVIVILCWEHVHIHGKLYILCTADYIFA